MEYSFECGCRFTQKCETIKSYDGLPAIDIDFYNIPLNCPATWALISSGRTKSVFQLDSSFGAAYAKKLSPDNIEHLSALAAILRPGCLNYVSDGLSMTDHFIERKHGREQVKYIDGRLEKYLSNTYGVMVYQEQAINIAKGLANFTPEKARALQSAIGKKKADKLAELRTDFIDGCIQHSNISKEIATDIFNNIEASNRYSFNLAHSHSYAVISYITAYVKVHFPLHFYCAAIKFVKDKEELQKLVGEMPIFGVDIKGPEISNALSRFNIHDGSIQYGWSEVKSVSEKNVQKFTDAIIEVEKVLDKEVKDLSWYEFLVNLSQEGSKTTIVNLIKCGLLDNTGVPRKEQLHEYEIFSSLSPSEMRWVGKNWKIYPNLLELMRGILFEEACQKNRIKTIESLISALQNPGKGLLDSVDFICDAEREFMGVAITRSKTTKYERYANIRVVNFLDGRGTHNMDFVVEVKGVDERIIKTGLNIGKRMANLKLGDRTGEMECTVFSKEWPSMKSSLVMGNVVLLRGSRNKDMSLRIEEVSVL